MFLSSGKKPNKANQVVPAPRSCSAEGTIKTELHELYNEHQVLGKGGQAQVFEVSRCDDKKGKKRFAAKMFRPDASVKHAQREAKMMEKLRGCPGTVQLEQLVKHPSQRMIGLQVIVMELYGRNLRNYLAQKNKQLKEKVVAAIVKRLACTLKLMHERGVVHRDLKLDNIFLERNAASPNQVVIGDFGLATDDEKDMCSSCGTEDFMSPEVFGIRLGVPTQYTAAVDVWGLGIMAYELLGECPTDVWDEGNFVWWVPRSDDAKDLVSRMLDWNPEKRCTLDDVLRHPWILKHTAAADKKPSRRWKKLLRIPGRWRSWRD